MVHSLPPRWDILLQNIIDNHSNGGLSLDEKNRALTSWPSLEGISCTEYHRGRVTAGPISHNPIQQSKKTLSGRSRGSTTCDHSSSKYIYNYHCWTSFHKYNFTIHSDYSYQCLFYPTSFFNDNTLPEITLCSPCGRVNFILPWY